MLQNTCLLLTLQGATATEIAGSHSTVCEELLSSRMWQLTTWHDSLDDSNLPCACTVSCIQNIICNSTVDIMAQDSSVSVVTRKWAVWLQNQILIPCSSRDFFHCIQTGFWTASAMCTEGLLSGVIPPSRSSYPLTSCILVENAWSCTFAPLYVFAV
jgi:hypothetical protein